MKLYFIRHGKASHVPQPDAQRPLTEGGTASVRRMAEVLRRMDVNPTTIYSSPRVRAYQTANLIAEALGKEVVIHEACNFDFSASKARSLVRDLEEEAEVLFVGHNPSMSDAVESITGAAVELSTGAVACVTRYYPSDANSAILKWLLTPKVVDAFFSE